MVIHVMAAGLVDSIYLPYRRPHLLERQERQALMTARPTWTAEQVRALGVSTTVATAASVLGIGRSLAYQLASAGTFPVPVIRAGNRLIVPVEPLLDLLLHSDGQPGRRLEQRGASSVNATNTRPADSADPIRSAAHAPDGDPP